MKGRGGEGRREGEGFSRTLQEVTCVLLVGSDKKLEEDASKRKHKKITFTRSNLI